MLKTAERYMQSLGKSFFSMIEFLGTLIEIAINDCEMSVNIC